MRPLISKKSFSCIIIGSAVMSYIIKYVMDFAEYGVRLVVKIWYDTIGGTGVISDAIPYCK